ncbi:hypothetical protein NBRC10513v2_004589 [Rhodotorula toruloides]|uniref:Uncharacterized alpha/beta hydrolase domain (DUF2235)-domain containing protein n=1 Tax=Rhodotorula toruloides TaxID=5286 RepID=A0A0K3CBJ7_RHOTO|nr:Uncharacterized alpha/beta hydrolase domain (DUF2235)-domain containing protein [Rhodotorula toruloides]
MKRLILFCDGTLEDADTQKDLDLYTNIGRLSRAVKELDERENPPVEQIKFYQSGVGTDEAALGGLVTGALGRGMMQKVRDLYDFVALNWEMGDEIYLFGFSRGAYTVRLLCSLLNVIGILPPRSYLHLFPSIFSALDSHTGKNDSDDHRALSEVTKLLRPLEGFRRKQVKALEGKFLVKCVGVFDTVATRGRPTSLRLNPPSPSSTSPRFNSFGFDESILEPIVENAFQALAIDERRIDYRPVLWKRYGAFGDGKGGTGGIPGQRLLQVWLPGAHADIGGSYKESDLSFLTLSWLVSETESFLAFDYDYLRRLVVGKAVAPWGAMEAHQSRIGEFRLAPPMDRLLPTTLNPATCEYFHPSLLARPPCQIRPDLLPLLKKPELFVELGEWEQVVRKEWTLATKLAKVGEGQEKAAVGGGAGAPGGDEFARPSSVTSFTDNESEPSSPASSTSSLPLDKPVFVSSSTSLPPYLPPTALPAYPHVAVTATSSQPPFDKDPDPFAVLSRRKRGRPTVLASAKRLLSRLESHGRHVVAQRYA